MFSFLLTSMRSVPTMCKSLGQTLKLRVNTAHRSLKELTVSVKLEISNSTNSFLQSILYVPGLSSHSFYVQPAYAVVYYYKSKSQSSESLSKIPKALVLQRVKLGLTAEHVIFLH